MRYGFWFDHFGWVIVIVLVVFGLMGLLAWQGAELEGEPPISRTHTHEGLK
jgi:hypothetical protein